MIVVFYLSVRLSVCWRGHSNLVTVFNWICSSSNTGFVRRTITKMADKLAADYQCPLSWSHWVIFKRISSKFHIRIASIKLSFKFEYGFCPTNDNQDGRQNGPRLSVSAVVVTLSHFLPDCFQISYIDYFYQTLTQVRIWALFDNQDGFQNGRHLSVCTCGRSNLVIYHQISSKFHQTIVPVWIWVLYNKWESILSPKQISPFHCMALMESDYSGIACEQESCWPAYASTWSDQCLFRFFIWKF